MRVRTKRDTRKKKAKRQKRGPHTRGGACIMIKRESTHSNPPPSVRWTQLHRRRRRRRQRHQSHSHIEEERYIPRPWYRSPCPKSRATVICGHNNQLSFPFFSSSPAKERKKTQTYRFFARSLSSMAITSSCSSISISPPGSALAMERASLRASLKV